ncbi:MAG: cupredoxin domain-containing protein [Hydrogenobacter sp.]
MRRKFHLILLFIFVNTVFAIQHERVEKKYIAHIDTDGVQRVNIKAGSYYFDPNYIVIKANIPAELIIVRESAVTPHDFVLKINSTLIKEDITKKGTKIRFTPTETGKFEFYCDKKLPLFPSHKEKGMWGIIEIIK